ncbi:hypothetical protein KBY24_01875 [Ruegeria pomeroyi]|uniref:PH domain-containing protein n=1 Tax=Ruegeria alba TaxID=2916756 RepID=A0ABS9NSR4_9RHOB|nr:hypothetical protein [Ruegeria alba]MCE8518264.1 hypothetical protein [Ruegeria pomeroyi]MCE8524143.1 hypothetical protein [Ruegeria pomeroyi]MCE8532121.1 hypothetical protein [Ruegeria pomeroyi]MCE8554961.1 hypothetical protein [Ruegeria pomeroyi]MCG6556772.1 hypothetical protein [Ruegeria alba]
MQDEVLATIEASAPRRWMALVVLTVLGGLLIYVAVVTPPAVVWQVFLIVLGALTLWLAQRMFQATAGRVEMTATELRGSDGTVIARIADIEALDRGVFAFKPSNGFLLRTSVPGGRTWQPGLWWRMGRRIGIGGVTPGSQTKFMAEMLSAMMAERDGTLPR